MYGASCKSRNNFIVKAIVLFGLVHYCILSADRAQSPLSGILQLYIFLCLRFASLFHVRKTWKSWGTGRIAGMAEKNISMVKQREGLNRMLEDMRMKPSVIMSESSHELYSRFLFSPAV